MDMPFASVEVFCSYAKQDASLYVTIFLSPLDQGLAGLLPAR